MAHETVFLEECDVVGIHMGLVDHFSTGDSPIFPFGVKDATLLGSAVFRPRTSHGQVEKYPSLEQKAAALFHSLAKNHAFHNGNKRTALLSTLSFLERNNRRLADVTDDVLFGIVTGLAEDAWPTPKLDADTIVAELGRWIREHSTARHEQAGSMRVSEFVDCCEKANCRIVDARRSWQIHGEGSIVSVRKSTPQLSGGVVKSYLRKLGLTENRTGISPSLFQDGVPDSADVFLRFRSLLQRLAHA